MHVISLKKLRVFWQLQPTAEGALRHWHNIVERTRFTDLNHLKTSFNSVDYVPPFTVFNVGGNKFRIIAAIHFNTQQIFVRHVFTHPEYDRWTGRYRTGQLS